MPEVPPLAADTAVPGRDGRHGRSERSVDSDFERTMTEFMRKVLDTQARAEANQQESTQAAEAKIAATRSRSTSPERRTTPTTVPFVSEEAGVPSRPANSVAMRMRRVQTSGGLSSS